jgi:hypothetical protein
LPPRGNRNFGTRAAAVIRRPSATSSGLFSVAQCFNNPNKNKMNASKWVEPPWREIEIEQHPTWDFYSSFHLWGHSFSPRRFSQQTELICTEANEIGEVGVTGPDQGEPSHHGAAIIRAPETVFPAQSLWWMVSNVLGRITNKFCKEHGIDGYVLYLTVHYRQDFFLLLPNAIIRSLGWASGIPVVISCVKDEDDPGAFAA